MARRASDLATVLRNAGLTVHEQPGWQQRGRDMAGIRGIVQHHTATSKDVPDANVVRVLRDGRSDLPGPLSQLGLDRQGGWHVIAAGRANHAGRGSWPGLDGNNDCLGVEAFHIGTGQETWPQAQLDSWDVGTAALCAEYNIDPLQFVIAHREWTTRKIDPYAINMGNQRQRILALTNGDDMTPSQESKLDDVLVQLAGLRDKATKTNSAVGRMERVHGQGMANLSPGGDVNVDELAAALSAQLGTDLARTLGRILSTA
jgi:hypothetical protein